MSQLTKKILSGIGLTAASLLIGTASAGEKPSASDIEIYLRPATVPAPADNLLTTARAELGKVLFFDPRLSGNNFVSCASCHNPSLGWSDAQKVAVGQGMNHLERSTPTILNTAYQRFQFWDGRMRTLEQQALGPIEADGEMRQDMGELMEELKAIPGYLELFEKAYPGEGIKKETVGKAIASFERTVVSTESDFDRWLKGVDGAMSDKAISGFKLFKGKAACIVCHSGFNFTDDGFHNIGLPSNHDEGRYAIKPIRILKGAFKTPTLRDVALTAPYMHNGEYMTLKEVVQHYNGGGKRNLDNLDPNMRPLGLSNREVDDIVVFLESLTGDPVEFVVPNLPVAH